MASLRDLPARPRRSAPTPVYPRRVLLGALALAATAVACNPHGEAGFTGTSANEWAQGEGGGGAGDAGTLGQGGGGTGGDSGRTTATTTTTTTSTSSTTGAGGGGGSRF